MLRGFNGQGPLPEISPVPATGIPKAPETKIFCLLSEDFELGAARAVPG